MKRWVLGVCVLVVSVVAVLSYAGKELSAGSTSWEYARLTFTSDQESDQMDFVTPAKVTEAKDWAGLYHKLGGINGKPDIDELTIMQLLGAQGWELSGVEAHEYWGEQKPGYIARNFYFRRPRNAP